MEYVKEKQYQIALAEVDEILYFSDESIVSKIPSSFKKFIKENKDNNYVSKINPYLSLEEQEITYEAKAIIALIYRSYILDKNEKEILNQKEKEEQQKIENEKRLKYNPDDIFKNSKKVEKNEEIIESQSEQTAISIIKENPLKLIIKKIKDIINNILKIK